MATKLEKIIALLEDENNEPVISPSYANESEFTATFMGKKDNFLQFCDADGDWWDCELEEIDYVILDGGMSIDANKTLKDD